MPDATLVCAASGLRQLVVGENGFLAEVNFVVFSIVRLRVHATRLNGSGCRTITIRATREVEITDLDAERRARVSFAISPLFRLEFAFDEYLRTALEMLRDHFGFLPPRGAAKEGRRVDVLFRW